MTEQRPRTRAELEALYPGIIETKDLLGKEAAEILGIKPELVWRLRRELGIDRYAAVKANLPRIAEMNHLPAAKVAEELGLTVNQVRYLRRQNDLRHGKKGIVSSDNRLEIGESYLTSLNGHMLRIVRVANDKGNHGNWEYEHKLVWEKAHGKLNKYWKVIHLDGDHLNNELSNLYAISPSTHRRLTHNKWFYVGEPEKQLLAIKTCEIWTELGKQGFDFRKFREQQKKITERKVEI